MKIELNNVQLAFLFGLIQKTVSILASKNPKPHEESGRLLEAYSNILEKVKWVVSLPKNEGPLTLNRVEAKAILMQMDISKALLSKTRETYESLPEDQPPFDSTKESRTKATYLKNIDERLLVVDTIKSKIQEKL